MYISDELRFSLKWQLFRLLFFAVLTVDCISSVNRAPAYASPVRVSHAEWLYEDLLPSWLVPGSAMFSFLSLTCACLCVCCAVGYHPAICSLLQCVLFTHMYMCNRIDGYQHHYLLCVLQGYVALIEWSIASTGCLFPWLIVRCLELNVGILYFYTAINKINTAFLSGNLLIIQMSSGLLHQFVHSCATLASTLLQAVPYFTTSVNDFTLWNLSAKGIVVTELFLAYAWAFHRLVLLAFPVGCALHLTIEYIGELSIGFFSYYMFIIYIFMVPDCIWNVCLHFIPRRLLIPRKHMRPKTQPANLTTRKKKILY